MNTLKRMGLAVVAVLGLVSTIGADTPASVSADESGFCGGGYGDVARVLRTGTGPDGEAVYGATTGPGAAGLAGAEITVAAQVGAFANTVVEAATRVGVNGNWGITKMRIDIDAAPDIVVDFTTTPDEAVSHIREVIQGTATDVSRARVCVIDTD